MQGDVMKISSPTKTALLVCSAIGIILLIAQWVILGELSGFFLMLVLTAMFLLRWRKPHWGASSVCDVAVCLFLWPGALVLPLFWAMYHRMYFAAAAVLYVLYTRDFIGGALAVLGALAGVFLGLWEQEHTLRWKTRDTVAERYYELESAQRDLLSAATRVERMTLISERARIAREIHDNAGHEIVAAYMSLQTLRGGMKEGSTLEADDLAFLDAALERLDSGTQKIREAVHNLAPVTALGIEALEEICRRFTAATVVFNAFGDTTHVPVYVWNALESCLNEALTNASKHTRTSRVTVTVDVTPSIVRLCAENDNNTHSHTFSMGAGLRNLRYRMTAIGGSLAVDAGDIFKLICVVPIRRD
jgi:signal transduction histidine kinase